MNHVYKAYAKINLGLRILAKREDGYHEIETVFHCVDVFDEIKFAKAPELSVVSSSADAPSDESNICYKAAQLVAEHLGVHQGARISINKQIPVGAGLGGGSSDAATVLKHLPRFWNHEVDDVTLNQFAQKLGSDVPFFLGNSSARGTGRGEVLDFFSVDLPYHILLCNPNIHVSTAWAYAHVTLQPATATHPTLKEILDEGLHNPGALSALRNDFEPSVFKEFPVIRQVKEELLKGGAAVALMSGSGSSVFGLFRHRSDVDATSERLSKSGFRTFHTPPEFRPETGSEMPGRTPNS